MKKQQRILLISLLLLVIVIGCIVKFRGTDDRPKVVVVLQELDSQYWNIVKAGVEKGEEVKRNIDTGVDIISKDNAKLKLDFLRELLK